MIFDPLWWAMFYAKVWHELFIQPIRGMEIRALREKDNIHDDQIRMINQALIKEGIL